MGKLGIMAQRTFNMAGIHVSKLPAHHTLGRHLMTLFELQHINCVLDIGAHHGEYARRLRDEIGYKDWIISFEPCRESFAHLSQNMNGDSKWYGYRTALGDQQARLEMNVFAATDLNSFRSANTSVTTNTLTAHFASRGKESVEVQRLDHMMASIKERIFSLDSELGQSLRVFMKMDTQGYDINVFRGAKDCLTEVIALQSELPCRRLYQDVPSMGDSLNEYESMGYLPSFFFPTTVEKNGIVSLEFDCVLKKDDYWNCNSLSRLTFAS